VVLEYPALPASVTAVLEPCEEGLVHGCFFNRRRDSEGSNSLSLVGRLEAMLWIQD
jgi:hypothetical protein